MRPDRRDIGAYRKGNFNPLIPCGTRRWQTSWADLPREYFNPLAPCGARHNKSRICSALLMFISIHSLLMGETKLSATIMQSPVLFNPLTSYEVRLSPYPVSFPSCNFNPLAPCGARRMSFPSTRWVPIFQSTRPVWGETVLTM